VMGLNHDVMSPSCYTRSIRHGDLQMDGGGAFTNFYGINFKS